VDNGIKDKITFRYIAGSYKCVTNVTKKQNKTYFYARVGSTWPGVLKKGSFRLEADAAFAANQLREASGVEARKSHFIVHEKSESDEANFGSEESWIEARNAEMETRHVTEISAEEMKVKIDERIEFTLRKNKS
jgi:hypothetical protein